VISSQVDVTASEIAGEVAQQPGDECQEAAAVLVSSTRRSAVAIGIDDAHTQAQALLAATG
jgi:hypothetical protein